ncbi:MAG TPA: AMP-binding protein [Azospirillum sp.]|nr:AMP-binding protein [Azospirillum sp.]
MLPIDFLYRSARFNPGAVAVDAPSGTLSYAELVARVDALAAGLQGLDPTPGSRVGICAHNTVAHLLALLATLAAGKVWVPLNPRENRPELDSKVATTTPSILVVDEDCMDNVGVPPGVHRVLGAGAGGADSVAGLIAANHGRRPQRVERPLDSVQAIKFTGGSSGRPKGVLQPCRAWVAGAVSMMHGWGLGPDDGYLVAAPLTHGTSCYVTPILAAGGRLVFLEDRTSPAGVLEALESRHVTLSFVPPTLIYMMEQELAGRRPNAPRLRHLIYGAAPMPPEKVRQAIETFGPIIGSNYGQTEAPQVITVMTGKDYADGTRLASCGRPGLLARVEVMDREGRILPPGEEGEIVVRGDLVMLGYLDMPEATAETLRDGWLHTGDVGVFDGLGYLTIKDRLRDVIITGGFNVYPNDVEAVLVRHPAVREAVVFGVPDEKWGEAVHAAVTPRPGATVDADAVIAHVKAELGSVKAPKRVHVVPELPRNPVGKVVRREARERILGSP